MAWASQTSAAERAPTRTESTAGWAAGKRSAAARQRRAVLLDRVIEKPASSSKTR
ncbi:hypothetical protein [Streptomyces sp. NPDC055140]